jgi:hypothetical protein
MTQEGHTRRTWIGATCDGGGVRASGLLLYGVRTPLPRPGKPWSITAHFGGLFHLMGSDGSRKILGVFMVKYAHEQSRGDVGFSR